MESYFAATRNKEQLVLDQNDTHHLVRVLRHKIGDEVVVVWQATKYLTKIINLEPVAVCQIIKALPNESELPVQVTLIMALLKEQKFDLVVQKAVELGVTRIVPIQLTRSVSIVSNLKADKLTSKVERWQKIAKAAAKQSNRNVIPEVTPIVTQIASLKSYQSDVNFVAYENAVIGNWEPKLKAKKSVSVVVGPEGGISEQELEQLAQLNFAMISLGKTILRAETAPLYFLAVVNYYTTMKKEQDHD